MRQLHGRRWRAVAVSAIGALVLAGMALAVAPTLDATFGTGGLTVLAGSDEYAFDSAPVSGGALLAVGSSGANSLLARVTADGAPDTTLGPGGRLVLDLDPGADVLKAVEAGAGGAVVVGGQAGSDSVLARVTTSGALDPTFAAGGVMKVDLGGVDFVRDVELDGVGRIVAGAYANGVGAVLRLTSAGLLDASFGGGDGVAAVPFDVEAVHTMPDGSILAAGATSHPGDLAVAKLDGAGTPDSSFGTGGVAAIDAGGSDLGRGLAVDAAGRILVSGAADTATGLEAVVARLLPTGAPDASFAGDGVATLPLGGAAIANAVVPLADGRVALVGADESAEAAFVLVVGADGSVDTADATAVDASSDLDGFEASFVAGGKLVAAGWASDRVAFARFLLSDDPGGGGGGGDTTPPVLSLPATITVDAVSPAGALVTFAAGADDAVDPSPSVACVPASGTVFPIGETTVSCAATDASGNTANGTFVVRVRGAAEQLARLRAVMAGVTPANVQRQLQQSVDQALVALERGKPHKACVELASIERTIERLSGPDAAALLAAVRRVAGVIDC